MRLVPLEEGEILLMHAAIQRIRSIELPPIAAGTALDATLTVSTSEILAGITKQGGDPAAAAPFSREHPRNAPEALGGSARGRPAMSPSHCNDEFSLGRFVLT